MGVDQSWSVDHREALAKGQTTPRLNEARITLGNRDGKARGDEAALKRSQNDVLVGAQVETRVSLIGIGRKLHLGVEALDGKRD